MTGAPLDKLLSRLEGVQSSGRGYRARCPACGGRSRKLSVGEGDSGRLLLHCFGGCGAAEVIEALSLELADLFPERLPANTPEDRYRLRIAARETQWGAALEMLEHEALIIRIAGQQLTSGHALTADDKDRLALAVKRVEEARGILRPYKANWRPTAVAS